MKPIQLRCFAERDGDVWVGYCLTLDISVYGDTLPAVKQSMHEAIHNYFETINALPAQERANVRIQRAPVSLWAKFYVSKFLHSVFGNGDDKRQSFRILDDSACLAT